MIKKTQKVFIRYNFAGADSSIVEVMKETWWLFWVIPVYTQETVLSIIY